MRALVLVIILALAGIARTVSADNQIEDYDPYGQTWRGMARFVGTAEGMGFEVVPVTSLEWSELTADDILFLVYPLQRVDPSRLAAFVQAGGNVVIADDFGQGKDALTGLGLIRADGAPHATKYYEGRAWAPIATRQSDHFLAHDVDQNPEGGVVTNHPATLRQIQGATTVIGFDDSAVVVAGERGTGKFVAISDPSIFINRMMQFGGNVQLTTNILRWLSRPERGGEHERRVVLLRGDVPMYGDPRRFIDDPNGGKIGRTVHSLDEWLRAREDWLLTPTAMKALAAVLAALLLFLALVALPIRRGPKIDGAWLRFGRPARRDEPHALVTGADRGYGSLLVLACILRDQAQLQLADAIGRAEPLYTLPETELVALVSNARGTVAGVALTRVYRRLRALPSRGQAAAPWSAGHLARRDFDTLYRDVAELCRTLGNELAEASVAA